MKELLAELKEYLKLNIDYARITAAEKLSVMLITVALVGAVVLLLSMVLFFLSMAVAGWIADSLGSAWAYFIVSGFYLLLLVGVVGFRKALIVNPIARFVSKLFMK